MIEIQFFSTIAIVVGTMVFIASLLNMFTDFIASDRGGD